MTSPDPTRRRGGRGRYIIASSRSMEFSFEGQENNGRSSSIFTAALLEGMRTGAADLDKDGRISVRELYEYISDKVKIQGARQTPQMSFSGEEENLYIAKAVAPLAGSRVVVADSTPIQSPSQAPVRASLASSRLSPEVIAGYSPDNLGAVDQLGFAEQAEALAILIASRQLLPPMSIGLFGGWGAGKSFFMYQLRRRIDRIAELARLHEAKDEPLEPYVSYIAQVHFNAWHYVDANMWASLATRIFQGIAEYLEQTSGSPGDAHRILLGQLETSQLLLKEAEQRQADAERALAEAERRVSSIGQERGDRSLASLTNDHPEVKEAAQQLVSDLGLSETKATLQEINDTVRDLRSASTTLGRAWTLFSDYLSGSVRRRILLVPTLIIIVGVSIAIPLYIGGKVVAAWLTPTISLITAIVSATGAIAQKATQIVQAGMELVGADHRDEKQALAVANENAEVARRNLRDAQGELDDLQALDATGVYRFVSERYASPEYAKYMGVVSLIEQDLRALSRLLTAPTPEQPMERGGRQMRVDRVVLYIDDLDRCPADTVIQVLQAIHLLLALPLFVVIVGVDSRWLLGALRSKYRDIAGGSIEADFSYLQSMPLSYLEKIFQIPYWVPSMDSAGYRRLIRSLVEVEDNSPEPVQPSPDEQGEPAVPTTMVSVDEPSGYADSSWREIDLERQAVTLKIEEQEIVLLEALGGFVPTPRAVKRLANVYRLLKASNYTTETAAFEGNDETPAEFPVAMLLSAIATGFPDLMQTIFERLSLTAAREWQDFVSELAREWGLSTDDTASADSAAAKRSDGRSILLLELLRTVEPFLTLADISVYKRWAPRVARFSFVGGLSHDVMET
jgi:hypothetical protein